MNAAGIEVTVREGDGPYPRGASGWRYRPSAGQLQLRVDRALAVVVAELSGPVALRLEAILSGSDRDLA